MKTTLFLIFLLTAFTTAFAYEFKPIKCESPRLSKSMVIRNNSVTFINKNDDTYNRAIASIAPARTQVIGKGFNQVLLHDNKKFHIHVSDVTNFNEVNDYIEIKTMEGHNIMYPISCTLK